MPTVPRYQTPQVKEAAISNVRFITEGPTSSGGAILAEGVKSLSRSVSEIAEREQQKADFTANMNAESKAVAAETELLYGPDGALNRKGEAAFGAREEVMAKYQETIDGIEKGLTRNQALRFRGIAESRKGDITRRLEVHTAQEAESHQAQVLDARISNSRTQAGLAYQDPQTVASNLDQIRSMVLMSNQTKGETDEDVIAKQVRDAVTPAHALVLTNMLSNPLMSSQAKAYFDVNKAEFGELAGKYEDMVKHVTLESEADRNRIAIMSKTSNYRQQMREADKLPDVALKDATMKRIEYFRAVQDRARAQQDEDASNAVYSILEKNAGDMTKVPVALLKSMSYKAQIGMQNVADGMIHPRETNWAEYEKLVLMASVPATRDKFMMTNIDANYGRYLAPAQRKEIVEMKRKIATGEDKDSQNNLDRWPGQLKILSDTMMLGGLDISKNSNEFAKVTGQLRRHIFDQQKLGKPVSDEDVLNWATRKTTKVIYHGWFTNEQYVYEMGPGQKAKVYSADISVRDRERITADLRAKGHIVSEANIKAIYEGELDELAGGGDGK